MTDRELLERAAKAAGMEVLWLPAAPGRRAMFWTSKTGEWNPLTDDGDALRLAVKLRLVIQHAPKYVVVMDVAREIAEHQDTRENDGDPYVSTRRAIVRAAAEMCSD